MSCFANCLLLMLSTVAAMHPPSLALFAKSASDKVPQTRLVWRGQFVSQRFRLVLPVAATGFSADAWHFYANEGCDEMIYPLDASSSAHPRRLLWRWVRQGGGGGLLLL